MKTEFITLQPAARQKNEDALARMKTLFTEVSALFDSPELQADLEVDCSQLRTSLQQYIRAMSHLKAIPEPSTLLEQEEKDFMARASKRRNEIRKSGQKVSRANLFHSKVTPRKPSKGKSTPAKAKSTPAKLKVSRTAARLSRKKVGSSALTQEVTPPPTKKRRVRLSGTPDSPATPIFHIPSPNPHSKRKNRKTHAHNHGHRAQNNVFEFVDPYGS